MGLLGGVYCCTSLNIAYTLVEPLLTDLRDGILVSEIRHDLTGDELDTFLERIEDSQYDLRSADNTGVRLRLLYGEIASDFEYCLNYVWLECQCRSREHQMQKNPYFLRHAPRTNSKQYRRTS